MRHLPKVIPVLIAIIAFDFMLAFGWEAWRILASPIGGLEQQTFANVVFGLGKLAGLKDHGIVKIAIVFGIINLAIAVVFAIHLVSRFRGHAVSHDALDTGLILVVVSTMIAATPAILQGASDILIQERFPLWLVGLAATLSMIERLPETEQTRRPGFWERLLTRRSDDTLTVAPVLRNAMPALRWDTLRSEAGLVAQPVVVRRVENWSRLR